MTIDRANIRLEKLRSVLDQKGLDAVLISNPENRRYLSGFTGSSGYLLILRSVAVLATDSRYYEQVARECRQYELFKLKGYGPKWLLDAASQFNLKKVGFEAAHLTFASYRQFVDAIPEATIDLQLIPEAGLVEPLRAVKEAEEIDAIARACALVHVSLKHVCSLARPGMTETELAWQLERMLREGGSQTVPFEVIVASGPNSALPHAHPTERPIAAGDPVLIDVGARMSGYCGDVTRTICLGEQTDQFRKIHDVVLGAQLAAIATIEAGMKGAQADSLARTVVEQAGYAEHFGHGLGHGVGLEVHEAPSLGPMSQDILGDSMTFTVEPGIYIPGWGGVRIEDTVVMESGRVKALQ